MCNKDSGTRVMRLLAQAASQAHVVALQTPPVRAEHAASAFNPPLGSAIPAAEHMSVFSAQVASQEHNHSIANSALEFSVRFARTKLPFETHNDGSRTDQKSGVVLAGMVAMRYDFMGRNKHGPPGLRTTMADGDPTQNETVASLFSN